MNTMHKFRILGLSLLLIAGISTGEKLQAQPGVSISYQTFYNELAPYGRWINTPQYGSVWTPYVDAGFQPYATNGYWQVTEYGNTWVSDYDWGWAPFHYGRWSYDDYNGWFWIPGYEWGPAWVSWRSGGGYYGWAPMGPGVNINVSINIPSFWWVFVPQQYISSRSWHNYWVPRGGYNNIYGRTTIINNYYRSNNRSYVYGPRRDEIERVTRRPVEIRQIDRDRRGIVMGGDRANSRGYGGNAGSYDRSRSYGSDNRGNNGYNNNGRGASDYNSGNRNGNNGQFGNRSYSGNDNRVPDNRNMPDNRSNNGNNPYNQSQPNRSNERSTPDRGYSAPQRSAQDYGSQRPQDPSVAYGNRGGEAQRQSPAPDQNRSRSYDQPSNSGRSDNYGGQNQGQQRSFDNGASMRSNSSERSGGGESRGGGRSNESHGGGGSERGSRSPR
ncbi:DUF6600 domain-containing protein [Dyadobacter subterraneus]|uniref:YXWGXW repeat-containing protein n=1 Tax=Dyadobacter subterraneus TaxID=2773304 RepID=A0ABR9WHV1_9BACT|nr:DUF6600 domain-containing protein [Dyadobacter subterraneus]MBE9465010.1 hypothetical protein [Dyadobacter subterraneus]